ELVEEVRAQDEASWDERRTTPKAFVSYGLAASLWATRWGTASVLRLPRRADTPEQLAYQLRQALRPSEMGVSILPVKSIALAASAGTTPFDGLFLGFSFFLMASAVMLTVLLFRLGVEGRAREVGLLLAAGMSPGRLRRLLLGEALAVAAMGAVLGAAAGVGYARLMIHGLNTWWVEATTTPFLELHVTPRSLLAGTAAGLGVALLTMMWSLRRFSRLPARQLLAGDAQPGLDHRRRAARRRAWLPPACFLGALALGLLATTRQGEAQAGAFFGGGVLALVGILVAVGRRLREPTLRAPAGLGLGGIALRNARRNPSRTMLSLALAATASFLIVALSAFRLAPTERGTGGFDLLATADLPLHFDLNTAAGRDQLGLSAQDSERLARATTVAFRVNDGEDASCLNLYQTTQPRILGAPPALAESSRFQWAMARPATAGEPTPQGDAAPWRLLDATLGNDADGRPIIPMVLDRNTAFYSL
ncbi:MAG TPA: ABC transporter permease, partial [Lacipirellulaceae bacterium]|nr:ABC transporter permease [Lacipirellulaceae bacterium]